MKEAKSFTSMSCFITQTKPPNHRKSGDSHGIADMIQMDQQAKPVSEPETSRLCWQLQLSLWQRSLTSPSCTEFSQQDQLSILLPNPLDPIYVWRSHLGWPSQFFLPYTSLYAHREDTHLFSTENGQERPRKCPMQQWRGEHRRNLKRTCT